MIPRKNREKFVKKYGNLWYLRDLDLLVENLADCGYNMTENRMVVARMTYPKVFAVYGRYDEAVEASRKVRETLGLMPADYPPEEAMTYRFD